MTEWLPEIARRWDSECTRWRLLLGCGTVAVLGAGLCAAAGGADNPPQVFHWFVAMQAFVLLGYGTARVVASVSDEKRQGTWDLQRLTPQTALQLAAGKLAGAPLYALILTAAFLPWALIAAAGSAQTSAFDVSRAYVSLGAAAAFAWAMGLVVSTHSDERQGLGDGGKFLMLAALYPLASWQLTTAFASRKMTEFYGATLPDWLFFSLSDVVFAAWAFESARCRIARDKLEPVRSWRLPAFVLFFGVYQCGFGRVSAGSAVIMVLPMMAVALATAAEPWGPQEWRSWLRRAPVQRLSFAPTWLSGLAAAAALAAALTAATSGGEPPSARFPLLFLFFATRDILFLQWCRLKIKRQPEFFALVYIGLAYVLPWLVALTLHLHPTSFLFFPAPGRDVPALVNLLPGALEAAGAAALLAWEARRLDDPERRPRTAGENGR
jgi:hypothetical protein